MLSKSTVLVVGASRGLGLALAAEWCRRGSNVTATVRSASAKLGELAARYPGRLQIETVDIVDFPSVVGLRKRLDEQTFDVLFVNAGIARANDRTPMSADEQDFVDLMLTNAFAPIRVVELLEDLVSVDGVIGLMSSELGSIAGNEGFWTLYSSSKAALNMLMKGFAGNRPSDTRAMLLVAPGWVRTDMGGESANLLIEDSIPHVVDTVEDSRGKAGLRYIDRFGGILPW